jgi:hypothetical protein
MKIFHSYFQCLGHCTPAICLSNFAAKQFGVLPLRETAKAETLPDMPMAEIASSSLS